MTFEEWRDQLDEKKWMKAWQKSCSRVPFKTWLRDQYDLIYNKDITKDQDLRRCNFL